MSGSVEDLGAPESWEVADLEESVTRLMLKDSKKETKLHQLDVSSASALASSPSPSPSSSYSSSASKVSDDVISQVDQFLRDALQNPRERLSILRMEQDIEKFIRDPSRQQLEFQQLPTSYLRLAAHRIAQHYSLQSMVLLDNSLPDGSGSRIIVQKTSERRPPPIRLADIPVNLPSEENRVMKVSIKQRPHKHAYGVSGANLNSLKTNSSKSVEERKEEYNRARARIFNSGESGSGGSAKAENETRLQENIQHDHLGIVAKTEGRSASGVSDVNVVKSFVDSTGGNRSAAGRNRVEKEPPVGRNRSSSRVAIFRDREVDRKDPDYDRSYDRYMQRFDPGFGFNGGPYPVQPMYTPAVNYNTEFPQLGSTCGPQISAEHPPLPLTPQLPGSWTASSSPAGIGYGHPETLMTPHNSNHIGARAASAAYLNSSQYPSQRPGVPYFHPHEHIRATFSQSYEQQPEMSFGLARPR